MGRVKISGRRIEAVPGSKEAVLRRGPMVKRGKRRREAGRGIRTGRRREK